MSAEQALFDAYRNWRRLAMAGHIAIGKRDWDFLLECQNVIQKLQPSIPGLHEKVDAEWKRSKADRTEKKNELRTLILELKELLESNQKLLRAARATALFKREQLGEAGRNLKRLQNSYVLPHPALWTSFS
jgi:hypothetical protein